MRAALHRRGPSRTAAFASVLFALTTLAGSQRRAPPSWGALVPGPHPVGVASFFAYDSSRLAEARPRIVQVVVWYPARDAAERAATTYTDYVALGASERGGGQSVADGRRAVEAFTEFLVGNGMPRNDVRRWLESPMLARFAAPRAAGSHPIVLIAQGNGQASYSQAVLAEYLASRGFVVATTPSPGRIGPAMQSEADILPVATAQAEDLTAALQLLIRQAWGDASHAAVVGHSFGARAALLLLDRRIASMLVSLDGGIANAQGREWLDRSPVDPAAIRGQVVHVFQDSDTIVRPDFTLLRTMTGTTRRLVKAAGLSHWHFTSFGTISAAFPTVAPGSTDAARARTAAAVMALTACVLEEWKQGDATDARGCFTETSDLSLVADLAPRR